MKLEPELWYSLQDIARAEACTIHQVIDRAREAQPNGSVASAIRVYVVRFWRRNMQIVDRVERQEAGRYFIEQSRLDLSTSLHICPTLSLAFAYWRSQTKGDGVPRFSDIRLDVLRACGVDQCLHLIGIEANDPGDYRVIRQAPVTVIHRLEPDSPLGSLGGGVYGEAVRNAYARSKEAWEPSLERVQTRTEEGSIAYRRLTMPMKDGLGKRTHLLVGVVLEAA